MTETEYQLEGEVANSDYSMVDLKQEHLQGKDIVKGLFDKLKGYATDNVVKLKSLGNSDVNLDEVGLDLESVPASLKGIYVKLANVLKDPEKRFKDQRSGVESYVSQLEEIEVEVETKLYGPNTSSFQEKLSGVEGKLYQLAEDRHEHVDAIGTLEDEINATYQRISKADGLLKDNKEIESRKQLHVEKMNYTRDLSQYNKAMDDFLLEFSEIDHEIERTKLERKELQRVQGSVRELVVNAKQVLRDYKITSTQMDYTKVLSDIIPGLRETLNSYALTGDAFRKANNDKRRRINEICKYTPEKPATEVTPMEDPLDASLGRREAANEGIRSRLEEVRKDPYKDLTEV